MDDVPQSILDEIREHCLGNPEEESCGVVFSYENYRFLPFPNENASGVSFRLNSKLYLLRDRIAAIVHSHPLSDAHPSEADKASSLASGVPFLIYSCLYDNFLYFHREKCKPLKG